MNIITAYPVYKNGKLISNNFTANTMNYSSANGPVFFGPGGPPPPAQSKPLPGLGGGPLPGATPSAGAISNAQKAGMVWDKARGIFVKAKELGLVDGFLNRLGVRRDRGQTPITTTQEPPQTKQPMSNTTKILLGVGGLVVVGLLVYAVTRPKTGK